MSQSRWDDLADRLLSRKFLLAVLMIVLALIGFWSGNLTFEQLQTAAIAAVGIYSATNAVETIATRPATPAPLPIIEASPLAVATPEMVAKNIAELVRAELDEMGAPSVTIKAGTTSITRRGTAEQTEALMPRPAPADTGGPIRIDHTSAWLPPRANVWPRGDPRGEGAG